jgi:prolyl 4-hydroxylase
MYLYESDVYNDEPLVAYIENFIAPSDCDELVEYSRPRVRDSQVVDRDDGKIRPDQARTSSDFFISEHEHQVNKLLRDNTAEFFGKQTENFEDTMIINYQKGQQYKAHFDFFVHKGIQHNTNAQREATAIFYLNDVPEGGETEFPHLGLKFVPKKGALIYFEYNYTMDINKLTLHAGLPPADGLEKWIATIWMRFPK